ncbi:MAG: hypothetical protein ACYC1K_02550 [Minisyncoccota bacterium]
MRKRKLYVGCALQFAPPTFVAAIQDLKIELKKHFNVLEFLFPHPGTDEDVYVLDIRQHVAKCDLMLAIADYPSTGLGYEMAVAIEKYGKPVLCLASINSRPSRLIMGINRPSYEFNRYNILGDVLNLLLDFESRKLRVRKPERKRIRNKNPQA